mmetsp:Transcript_27296/g.37612  ORF Transcript_27296/g.37612 Transcript_27296/m.37612 type:complete len:346 (-) Transcript_27296:217-1254(-)
MRWAVLAGAEPSRGQADGLDELLEGEGLGQEEVHAALQRLVLRGGVRVAAHADDQLAVRHHGDFEGSLGLQLRHQTQQVVLHQICGRLSQHSGLHHLQERRRVILCIVPLSRRIPSRTRSGGRGGRRRGGHAVEGEVFLILGVLTAVLVRDGRHVRWKALHGCCHRCKTLFLHLAELSHGFEAVHHRHVEVQQHDVILVAAHELQRDLSIAGLLHVVPVPLQREARQLESEGGVVHDQHVRIARRASWESIREAICCGRTGTLLLRLQSAMAGYQAAFTVVPPQLLVADLVHLPLPVEVATEESFKVFYQRRQNGVLHSSNVVHQEVPWSVHYVYMLKLSHTFPN